MKREIVEVTNQKRDKFIKDNIITDQNIDFIT